MSTDKTASFPVRMPVELMAKIEYAAEKLGLSKQDVMREAMKLGLAHYERIGWDVQGAVLDKSSALAPSKIMHANFAQISEKMVADSPSNEPLHGDGTTTYKAAAKQGKRAVKEG